MSEVKYISKIIIAKEEYDLKDEELRKAIEELLGPTEVQNDELNADSHSD